MLKKLNPAHKQSIMITVVLFIVILAKYIHSVAESGVELKYFAIVAVGIAIYSLILSFAYDEEVFTVKNAVLVLSIVSFVFGVLSPGKLDGEKAVAFTLAMAGAVLAKNFKTVLLPAVCAVLTLLFFEHAAIQSIPVYFAVSAVCLLPKIKKASLAEKIVFGISEVAMAVCTVYTLYNRRYSVSYYSLRGTWVVAVLLLVLAALLILFSVKAVMSKKSGLEIIGHAALLLVCIFCAGMTEAHILVAATTVSTALIVIMGSDTAAKSSAEKITKLITDKIKK